MYIFAHDAQLYTLRWTIDRSRESRPNKERKANETHPQFDPLTPHSLYLFLPTRGKPVPATMQFVCCTHVCVLNTRHFKMSRNISPSCHKHDRCIAGESLFVSPRNLSRRIFFNSLGPQFYFKLPSGPGVSLESVIEGDSARGNQVSSTPATPRRCSLRSSSSLLRYLVRRGWRHSKEAWTCHLGVVASALSADYHITEYLVAAFIVIRGK